MTVNLVWFILHMPYTTVECGSADWLKDPPLSIPTTLASYRYSTYHFTETLASFCASTTIFVNKSILRNVLCCKFNFSHSCSVILIILTTWTVIETLLTHLNVTSNIQ